MRARDRDRPACTLSCSRGFLQGLRDPRFDSFVTRVGRGDQRSVLPPPQYVMGFGMLESHIEAEALNKYDSDTRTSAVIRASHSHAVNYPHVG